MCAMDRGFEEERRDGFAGASLLPLTPICHMVLVCSGGCNHQNPLKFKRTRPAMRGAGPHTATRSVAGRVLLPCVGFLVVQSLQPSLADDISGSFRHILVRACNAGQGEAGRACEDSRAELGGAVQGPSTGGPSRGRQSLSRLRGPGRGTLTHTLSSAKKVRLPWLWSILPNSVWT